MSGSSGGHDEETSAMPRSAKAAPPEAAIEDATIADERSSRRKRPERVAEDEPIVPGYELIRKIGRGGMGVVWEALEHRLDRPVALKVHASATTPERVKQLWLEARLAAKIAHPGVVSVHDVGTTLDGRPYYTMDLVDGTPLRALLRDGALPSARAVNLVIDIADAVGAAHEKGVIHCDLKPGNVIVDSGGRVRVLDFGLAVRTDAEHGPLEVRGSPPYMAPEQVLAAPPTPATDVFALGVMLYELLTGALPLTASSVEDLLLAITRVPPPPPSHHNPAVPSAIEAIVMRCLEKSPDKRYANATALREALIFIREGVREESSAKPPRYAPKPSSNAPPARKLARDRATNHYRWQWTFDVPAERIWPFVANTDRFNKAVGLPEVEVRDTATADGIERTGQLRRMGMDVAWTEHPFEWVVDREHSVFREYSEGPLKALWNRVQLTPIDENRTELTHEIWVTPSGVIGRMAALVEIQLRLGSKMDRFYKRLASALASDTPPEDFFEDVPRPSAELVERADRGVRHLIDQLGFDGELVGKLEALVLHAPDKSVERIKPYAVADAWGVGREESLDLFLHAAGAGLCELSWDVICPECKVAHEAHHKLAKVARSGSCNACGTRYERDLARSVELVFRPHRALREVVPRTYCAGSPAQRPHVLAQQVVAPGETRTFSMQLARGDYRLVAARSGREAELSASGAGVQSSLTLILSPDGITAAPLVVHAGEVSVEIENGTSREEIFRVEVVGPLACDVTAAIAMAHPSFQELFSDDLLAHGEHLSIGRMAFLFVDVDNRSELFETKGDATTFGIFQAVEDTVVASVKSHQGSLCEIDAARGFLLGAFPTAAQALSAGLDALATAGARVPDADLRAAVHEGRCIALTRGGSIRYFGETLDRGAALLDAAEVGAVAVSLAVSDDRDAARVLHGADARRVVRTVPEGSYAGRRFTAVWPKRASHAPAAGSGSESGVAPAR